MPTRKKSPSKTKPTSARASAKKPATADRSSRRSPKRSGPRPAAAKKPVVHRLPPKRIGSPDSRRIVKQATLRVLAHGAGQTGTVAAERLGVARSDVHNMRVGNQLTVPILLKMVHVGRFDPRSILFGPKLKKLAKNRDVSGATEKLIASRIHKLAWTKSGVEWARLTGLSLVGSYGLRYPKTPNVRLGTVVAFMLAGVPLEHLFYGE